MGWVIHFESPLHAGLNDTTYQKNSLFLGSYTTVCQIEIGGSSMSTDDIGLNKWKSVAKEVMGQDFFMDFFSHSQADGSGPRYNLYRNSSEIVVLVELLGIQDVSQIKLSVHGQQLYVKGSIQFGYEYLDPYVEQLFSGDFEKKIDLPEHVHTKKVNAQYKQGLLIVQLFPRKERGGQGRGINIQG